MKTQALLTLILLPLISCTTVETSDVIEFCEYESEELRCYNIYGEEVF